MRWLFVLSLGALGACVGSDPETFPAGGGALQNDAGSSGGADGGNGGNSTDPGKAGDPSFAIQAESADATVLEGATTTVKVLLTRKAFTNGVTITASGLNRGVTIAPLEIGAGGTEGTLTITAAVGAAHGITTVSLKGIGDGVADQTATLNLLVRSAAGTFDNSFGTSGKATGSGAAAGLALQSDGKLVIVGNAGTETFIARHSADGSPDLSFGGTGRVSLPSLKAATDVVVRSDGKIFVAGNQPNGTTDYFAVTRLSDQGVVDTGFGTNGTRAFNWPSAFGSNATSIGLDAAGDVVVGGYRYDGTDGLYDFAILRLTGDDGHLDPKFSGDGFDNLDFFGGGFDMAYGMAVKPDGTVVLVGGGDQPNAFALARYLPGGNLDTGLKGKGTGYTTLVFPSTTISVANGVAIQPDNKMIAVGYLTPNSGSDDPAIARFDAGGTPDKDFGTGGSTITAMSVGAARFASVALQSNGAIVAAGYAQSTGDPTTSQFLLARYTSAGVLDPDFATTGVVKTAFAGEGDRATRIVLQPDGRILVAGSAGTSNYGIARYWY